jgi:hypothetical protein
MNVRRLATASLIVLACLRVTAQQSATTNPPRVVSAVGGLMNGKAAGLGDLMIVKVTNFDALLDAASGKCAGIVLYLDAMPLRGMPPQSCDRFDGTVRFLLDRVPDANDNEWHRLLGSPNGFIRPVRVSVGSDDQFAYPTNVTNFKLNIIPPARFYLFLILFVVSLVLFIHLCRRTNIIRSADAPLTGTRPYSLSRFQMSFWFFIVIAGYMFMWLITGELDTITDSVLALIGIGAGTALGAALIDSTPAGTAQATTATTSTDATSAPTTTVTQVAVTVPTAPPPPSAGFLNDILSDDVDGISIHRFQMFAWTLILGIIFVSSVYKELAMPEFNATLLGLMGISSGTYLGFKFPEKKKSDAAAVGAAVG